MGSLPTISNSLEYHITLYSSIKTNQRDITKRACLNFKTFLPPFIRQIIGRNMVVLTGYLLYQ